MIAVIGATGFTGRRVVAHLRQQYPDEELVALVRSGSRRELLANERVSYRTADLADLDGLRQAFRGARLVASAVSLGFGTAPNLVAALLAARPQHVIFFSTMAIYSTLPLESRDIRMEAERFIAESGLPATIFRPTMIYGRPGDRNIERLLKFLRRSPVMPVVGPGTTLQQPVHVDDLAAAVGLTFQTRETIGRSYNLPGPRPMSFLEVVRAAARSIDRGPMLIPVPLWLAHSTVRGWSKTGLWPRIRAEQVLRLAENKQADAGPAARDFGYSPRDFDQGVTEEATLLGLAPSRVVRGRDDSVFGQNLRD
jgi:nucleoside-diphosphate-sugar epimerase